MYNTTTGHLMNFDFDRLLIRVTDQGKTKQMIIIQSIFNPQTWYQGTTLYGTCDDANVLDLVLTRSQVKVKVIDHRRGVVSLIYCYFISHSTFHCFS